MNVKRLIFLMLLILAISGCAHGPEVIKTGSITISDDVFTEFSGNELLPGNAALQIYTTFKKTNLGASYGTLLINIDGRAIQLKGTVIKESREPRGLRDHEAGEGMRYNFKTVVQLPAGTHRIIVALPNKDIAVEREIVLAEGSKNYLQLEPNYYRSRSKQKHDVAATSFNGGIQSVTVKFNGKEL